MGATLHQSLLMVTDLDASIEFYCDIVGLEPDVVEEENVEFATGQCTLVLESDFDQDTLNAFGLDDPGRDRGDGVIVAISVDDVNEVYERATDAGVTVRMDPTDVSWDRRMMLLADPDGYTVEISVSL